MGLWQGLSLLNEHELSNTHINMLLKIKRVRNTKFLNGRHNVLKMSIIPKIIYTTDILAIKISVEFLCEIDKLCIMKNHASRLIRKNVEERAMNGN